MGPAFWVAVRGGGGEKCIFLQRILSSWKNHPRITPPTGARLGEFDEGVHTIEPAFSGLQHLSRQFHRLFLCFNAFFSQSYFYLPIALALK